METHINRRILAELAPHRLVWAYAHGLFPMVEGGRLMWFSPDPRGLLPLDERFHVSRRLAWTIRRGRFKCLIDKDFRGVISRCADRPEGTWISPEVLAAYTELHELGLAHSVEAYPADRVGEGPPVGGVYGVAIGKAFFAESMFHTATDAGKVALVHLVEHLRSRGFTLCDIQWTTPNLCRLGAFEVPVGRYRRVLASAISGNGGFL